MNPYTPYGNEPEENQTDFFEEKRSFKDTFTPQTIVANGKYQFQVKNINIQDFEGSKKIPPCEKAHLTLEVEVENGTTFCFTDLYLCDKGEWKVCAFLKSINAMKPGEEIIPTWDSYVGTNGWALFEPYTYINRFGDEKTVTNVRRFLA